ncbi:MAG: Asp-tRNA(Asn)/Glu-tRNA(Gln) amidotransferase subunit GatB, partial [Acetivibrionales bacterium]
MKYDLVIGLEIHSELKTSSKIFCGCKNEFGGEPNTRCCPVCLGMPGTLPVLNKKVLEYAIKAGLAMQCKIAGFSKFDRKNYFYPDMPKAYQISQHDFPICYDGYVEIDVGDETKRIGIERIHIEEDAGKLIHSSTGQGSLIDYNRSGVPLIEIVTRPDINSPEEAKILLETIKTILEYTEVSDCKMQEGSLRADVNLSLKPKGSNTLGARTEMKNINSLRAVQRAAQAEAERQARILDSGQKVYQETRRWDDHKCESFLMRGKDEVMDYRCFPEPDLPPVCVEEDFIIEIQASVPELPGMRRERYVNQFGIPRYDAELLTSNKHLADLFESASQICDNPKLVSNWIMTEIMKRINEKG